VTTTFFLVRHAAHDNVGGFLAGRLPGIRLGPDGRSQAARLGERMRRERFDAIHASPLERARETAEAIATASGVAPVRSTDALDEVDFGEWSGKDFETLDRDPHWRQWNTARSLTRTPGGETMLDVQRRVLALMEELMRTSSEGALVLVSHSEVIKAALSHVLGLPTDAWMRFDIDPASISTIVAGDWGAKVVALNETVH
jgi:broad specificity phosphatase PhoE